ncbi:unnamed protein product [Onchocerca flexuosa]|uniref:PX domain-containing protein n=1 Tax=Onchocerca flexuosa TaxID=387005 RepID=A0A183HUU3_9BILA|nr:unnamed protein product [Onchocerca flexuosa]
MSLEKHSHQYFKRFHYERMDELRMFLENEVFALCPVPLQFTLFDLQEFSFLKESREHRGRLDSSIHSETDLNPTESVDFQILQPTDLNPFIVGITDMDSCAKDINVTVLGNMKSSLNDDVESERYSMDDNFSQLAPVLCNTSLNLLRFIGLPLF